MCPNKLPELISWERDWMHQGECLFRGKHTFGRVSPSKDVRFFRTSDFAALEFFLKSFPSIVLSKRDNVSRVLPMSEIIVVCRDPTLVNFELFWAIKSFIIGQIKSVSKLWSLLPRVCPESGCVPISYFPKVVLLYESKMLFGNIPYERACYPRIESD